MQTATAWRRRKESTPRRGGSPTRPPPESIERISPDPDHPETTPSNERSPSYINPSKRQYAANSLQGLGLSQSLFPERSVPHPDHMYLDANGSAHLGAKLRSPKHSSHHDHSSTSARSPSAKTPSQYHSSKGRGHTRSGSTIDDLASIAIATSPQFSTTLPTFAFGSSPQLQNTSRPSTSYVNGYTQESFDRPAKRIKSERYFTQDSSVVEERPRTSSAHRFDIKPEDVELLLNVRNGFRAPVPSSAPTAQAEFPSQPVHSLPNETTLHSHRRSSDQDVHDVKNVASEGQDTTKQMVVPTLDEDVAVIQTEPVPPAPVPSPHKEAEEVEEHKVNNQEALPESAYSPENDRPPPIQTSTGTVEHEIEDHSVPLPTKKQRRIQPTRVAEWCSACKNTQYGEAQEGSKIDWIECVGCKRWLHYPCAGFQNAQDVKKVDKFICKECVPVHGETTYVRTSSRARTAPDYAALNEGLTKSSDEDTMHHYIPKFKNNELHWRPDDFARIRPALLTEEWWENMDGMKRPFVVPAMWNPKFGVGASEPRLENQSELASQVGKAEHKKRKIAGYVKYDANRKLIEQAKEPWDLTTEAEADKLHEKVVIDLDQDYLGMVMPHDLTVRKVAELYGPNEPVPVIDVKSQATKGKFTLRQWANYYEQPEGQPIRNVISLEISQSRLGRLIRRPKVVQDIDLEDQVWDLDSRSAINKKSVAYYCLMSVADSYTDFHIDFGGSSVYYHILKGMKTFFFIPPEERYLKKYEEWCNSADQGQTWLGDLCNGHVTRVDLYPGDTAFIPAGWIHSVWTPKDSLVIGGNFLTRYDLDLQIKVAQIEKDTDVALPYRYPFFQKVMWYTLIKYLDDDPVPESIIRDFLDDPDYRYLRANPIWAEQDPSIDHEPEEGDYNARNYSKSELRGLPALRDYLYRTARIHADLPVEKIDKKKIEAVKRSIPKGHGDPMQMICLFAVWCAWKIGNVTVPEWVYSDLTASSGISKVNEESKKAERIRIPPERSSARRRNQNSPAPDVVLQQTESEETNGSPAPSRAGLARIACEGCRKKKQACRHVLGVKLEETVQQTLEKTRNYPNVTIDIAKLASASPVVASVERPPTQTPQRPASATMAVSYSNAPQANPEVSTTTDLAQAALARMGSQPPPETNGVIVNATVPGSAKKGRSKACDECRKSKRRCVHDVNGRVDPVKAAEPSKPRGSSSSKRPARISDEHQSKKSRHENDSENQYPVFMADQDIDAMIDPALMAPIDPMLGVAYHDPSMPLTDVNAFSTPPHPLTAENSFSITGAPSHLTELAVDPALMDQQTYDGSMVQSDVPAVMSEDVKMGGEQYNEKSSKLPQLGLITVRTPDVDKSFSPITADTSSAEIAVRSGGEEDSNVNLLEPPLQDRQRDGDVVHTNGATHSETAAEDQSPHDQRRHSSNATGISPKQEIMSPFSRRSSSHTSGNTHEAASAEQSAVYGTGAGEHEHESTILKEEPATAIKQEMADITEGNAHLRRASTAASSVSDVAADEEFARQLQMEEMGLRRRTSVRAP